MNANNNFKDIEDFILNVLSAVNTKIEKDSVKAIKHYVQHAEYEMTFEGLFIGIMKLSSSPKIDFDKSYSVALQLKLDEEPVFDEYFWGKFQAYIKTQKQ